MAGLDRSQFKATSTDRLKKLKVQEDKQFGSQRNDDIKLTQGMNKIRLAPKFPQEDEYYHMRKIVWLPFQKEDNEMSNRPCYDSRLHGGTELDIVDEYSKFLKAKLSSSDESEAKKLKDAFTFQRGVNNINYSTDWIAYGWKLVKDEKPVLREFPIAKVVRDAMCSISIIEDEDEAMDFDPFTDESDGKPILIEFNKDAKVYKDKHSIKIAKNPFPLTDEMFEELIKSKPLTELYRNNYDINSFEKALASLRIYDIDNQIDLIDSTEFLSIIDKVRDQYKSSSDKKEITVAVVDEEDEDETPAPVKEVVKKATPAAKVVVEEVDEEGEDEMPAAEKVAEPVKAARPSIEELRERMKKAKEAKG